MKYLGLSLVAAFSIVMFSQSADAKVMKDGGLQGQDTLNEVLNGESILPGQLAHRYDESLFPPVGDIPLMLTPMRVERGDAEKIGIR